MHNSQMSIFSYDLIVLTSDHHQVFELYNSLMPYVVKYKSVLQKA